MSERSAWFCPACQKHHAPHVETCPRGTGGVKVTGPIFASPIVYDPCANCKGPCGNVACPKMPRVTCAAPPHVPHWSTIIVGQATTGGIQ